MTYNIKDEHLKILSTIDNPTVAEVRKLSNELNIDIETLAIYFMDKISEEMEKENLK